MGWSVFLNCALALLFAAVANVVASVVTVPLLGGPWGVFVAVFLTAVGVLTVSGEDEP